MFATLYESDAAADRIVTKTHKQPRGGAPFLVVESGRIKGALKIAAGRLGRRHKARISGLAQSPFEEIVDRGDVAVFSGVAVVAGGAAQLDQTQFGTPRRYGPGLPLSVGDLSVDADGQNIGQALANKAARGQRRAVLKISAFFQQSGRHPKIQHAAIQQPGAAEQVEHSDLAPTAVVFDEQAHRVGALREGKVANGVGAGVQTDPFRHHAVHLDDDQGRTV